MYLSKLTINLGRDPRHPRPGRTWLKNPYRVHQRLCMAFPDDERKKQDPAFVGAWPGNERWNCHLPRTHNEGFLFRIEPRAPARILVQSAQEPQWSYAFQNALFLLADDPITKPFNWEPVGGELLHFRLRANPVVRKNAKRQPLIEGPAQGAWLEGKAADGGFELLDFAIERVVRQRSYSGSVTQDRKRLTHLMVDFEGVLRVTDAEAFAETIASGIGAAKAFGCGLLSVAPVRA